MQITRIQIKNFRGIEDLDLIPGPALAVFGCNGDGKSSLLQGICYGLFGHCAWTNKLGGPATRAAELIRDGANEARITVDVDLAIGPGRDSKPVSCIVDISRGQARSWTCVDGAGEIVAETPDAFWKLAGIDQAYAEVAAFPGLVVRSKEIGGLLSDVLAHDVNVDILTKAAHRNASEWISKQSKGAVSRSAADGQASDYLGWVSAVVSDQKLDLSKPAEIVALGKFAFDKRRDEKRELGKAKGELEDLAFTPLPKDVHGKQRTVDELPVIEKSVEVLESHANALRTAKGKAQAALSVDEVADLQSRLETAQTERAATDSDVQEHARTVADREGELDDARHNVGVCATAHGIAEVALTAAKGALAGLSEDVADCLECGRAFVGNEADAYRERLIKAEDDAVDKFRDTIAVSKSAQNALLTAKSDLAIAKDSRTYAEKQRTELDKTIAELEAELKRAPSGPSADDITADIEAIEEKIRRGKDIGGALQLVTEHEHAATRVDALNERVDLLNWAVEAFHKGTVTNEFLDAGADDFTERVNATLSPLRYSVDVKVSGKAVSILLTCPDEPARPLELCSDGQRMVAELGLALAFADDEAPVLVDNGNGWDLDHRVSVLRLIAGHSDKANILLAVADQSDEDTCELSADFEPLAFVRIQRGVLDGVWGEGREETT